MSPLLGGSGCLHSHEAAVSVGRRGRFPHRPGGGGRSGFRGHHVPIDRTTYRWCPRNSGAGTDRRLLGATACLARSHRRETRQDVTRDTVKYNAYAFDAVGYRTTGGICTAPALPCPTRAGTRQRAPTRIGRQRCGLTSGNVCRGDGMPRP